MNEYTKIKLQTGIMNIRNMAMSGSDPNLLHCPNEDELHMRLEYISGLSNHLLTVVDGIEVDDESPNHD